MSKNPWQRLLQYIAAHIHEPVEDNRADRALATASGRLASNPPYAVVTRTLEFYNDRVLGHAISPHGKLALVVARDGFTCGLVTWSHEEGWREQERNDSWQYDPDGTVQVSFPHGSDHPLVVISQIPQDKSLVSSVIHWGNLHLEVINLNQVVGIRSGEVWEVFTESGQGWMCHRSSDGLLLNEPYRCDRHIRWIGIVAGRGANIWVIGEREGLDWHYGTIGLPEGQSIQTETFVLDGRHLQFVTYDGNGNMTVWRIEGSRHESYGPFAFSEKSARSDHHGSTVYQINQTKDLKGQLHLFKDGLFKPFGEPDVDLELNGEHQIHRFGDRVVVVWSPTCGGPIESITRISFDGNTQPMPGARRARRVVRMHNGIAIDYRDDQLYWMNLEPNTQVSSAARVIWRPLYSTPFDRLTAIEDEHGKSIMTWGFTQGTVHVLQYPLPT